MHVCALLTRSATRMGMHVLCMCPRRTEYKRKIKERMVIAKGPRGQQPLNDREWAEGRGNLKNRSGRTQRGVSGTGRNPSDRR
jgi:hypothetical protein